MLCGISALSSCGNSMVAVRIGGVKGYNSDTNCQLGEKNKQNMHLKILS